MAVTSDPFDSTELAAMIPEVWTPIVMEEMFAKTCAANFITDLSPYAQEGGDIFHVPDVFTNSFTAQSQSTQGAEITTDAPAQADVTLTVNTHKYIAYLLGDKDMKQLSRSYDFNGVYARKAGKTLADDLEDAIFALWSGLSTNSSGDTATVLTDLEIRTAISKLAQGNFDLKECGFFIHPATWWEQLCGIQKYYDISQYGPGTVGGLVREGNIGPMDSSRGLAGQLYGIPVYTSTNVVTALQTRRNLLLHKGCFGFAVQTISGGNRVRVQSDYLVQNIAMLTVLDILYGVVELRDAAGVVVNSNSSAGQA